MSLRGMTKLEKGLLISLAKYILWAMHPLHKDAKHSSPDVLAKLIKQVEAEE